ncbi:MAG TPA: hypothetical protein VGQ61_04890, partial [Candidatus Angelobacter sp.]|nr:hypothetical protein [Candidatus Angelobacter sp.]
MSLIEAPEKREKRLRPLSRLSSRIALWLLFSTKRLWGVGLWLKDTGRGLQKSGDPVIGTSGDRKTRNFNHKGHPFESQRSL